MTLKITSLALEEEHTGKNLNKLADMIWGRKDSLMFVVGSNSCIRSIYLKAIKESKTHQFSYCHIYKMDYILGKAEEKIKSKLLDIITLRKKAKIFIYISCMEIITAINFDKIIEEIRAIIAEVNIFVIKRGPMVKRYMIPKENLEQILSNLDSEEKEIEKIYDEPVFAGEVEILATSLEYCDYKKCIIEPGGCTSCLKKNGCSIDKDKLYSTTFNDVDLTLGIEKQIIEEGKKVFLPKDKIIFLQTILPQITGFNDEVLEEFYLEENKYFFNSEDGKDSFKLLKKIHTLILNDIFENSEKGNQILLCAYSNLIREMKEEFKSEIKDEKYIIKLNKQLPKELRIVNMEGLIFMAAYNELEKIPYEIIYPQKLHFDTSKISENKKILILGDPIHITGYKKILKQLFINIEVELVFYFPNIELEKEINEFLGENIIEHCNEIKEIISKIDENTILIADKEINNILSTKILKKYDFIEMPYHWLSGYNN